MTFELLRVNGVRRGSPGAQAGLHVGYQIIAVDGRVFPSVAALAAYVGDRPGGLSTGSKVAIGVGAAALFGCCELGCFSRAKPGPDTPGQLQPQQPGGFQQR